MRTTNGVYIRSNKCYFVTKQNTPQQPAVFNRRISYVDIVSLKKENAVIVDKTFDVSIFSILSS